MVENIAEMDLAALPSGVYVVEIRTENGGILTQKNLTEIGPESVCARFVDNDPTEITRIESEAEQFHTIYISKYRLEIGRSAVLILNR